MSIKLCIYYTSNRTKGKVSGRRYIKRYDVGVKDSIEALFTISRYIVVPGRPYLVEGSSSLYIGLTMS